MSSLDYMTIRGKKHHSTELSSKLVLIGEEQGCFDLFVGDVKELELFPRA